MVETQKVALEKASETNKAIHTFLRGMLDAEKNNTKNSHITITLKGIDMAQSKYANYKITRRSDGRYQAAPMLNGQRKFIYGKTQSECYQKLKEFIKENKPQIKQKALTVSEYFELWWKTYKEPVLAKSTQVSTKSYFRNHILPILGNLVMNKVTALQVNTLINKCKNRTKEYISQYTAMLFRQAYKDKIINNNIAEDFVRYSHKRSEGVALTVEQRQIFLQNCELILHGDIFKFYFYSGARPGEGLRFAPADIMGNCIRIPGTKTEGANRILPLFEPLKKLFDSMTISSSQKTVFSISEKTLDRQLKELNQLCGFKFSTKDLRTTFGTMCAEMGIPDNIIAKWMGHASEITTKKYYIKIQTKFEKEQVDIFNKNI